MKTITFEAPAQWASLLINNDFSGLNSIEALEALHCLAQQGENPRAIACSENAYIGKHNGLMREMLSYTARVNE
jgi:hypothetical protein